MKYRLTYLFAIFTLLLGSCVTGKTQKQRHTFKKTIHLLDDKPEARRAAKQGQSTRERVRESIFSVTTDSGYGTAFQVTYKGSKIILTNAHVCDFSDKVTLTDTVSKEKFVREVIKVNEIYDLCLIKPIKERSSLRFGNAAYVGQSALVVGHPHGWSTVLTQGEVFEVDAEEEIEEENRLLCFGPNLRVQKTKDPKNPVVCLRKYSPILRTTIQVLPGSSGSPILDRKGRVIGVIFMHYTDGAWGAGIPLSSVFQFLKEE